MPQFDWLNYGIGGIQTPQLTNGSGSDFRQTSWAGLDARRPWQDAVCLEGINDYGQNTGSAEYGRYSGCRG